MSNTPIRFRAWKERVRTAPRPELEQALLRIAIPAMAAIWICGDWLNKGNLSPEALHGLFTALGFLTFAIVLAAHIVIAANSKFFVGRRLVGILADNAVNTYFMLVMGEGGAVVVGIYLFVTFGNGFRYGRMYLHASQVLSLIGFTIVLFASDFWSHHIAVGVGFLVAMIVLPFYVGVLAERITEAKKRADEANQAKGRFMANVSHEMRTPLNGVIAMSDLLRETQLQETQREIVETLATSAQLALAQIEEVLDAAKIEAGRIQLECKPFDLEGLLSTTVKVVLPQARYKGLTIELSVQPDAAGWYSGDAHHLRQVMLNLLSNAVKFTDQGRIDVRALVQGVSHNVTKLRIEVQDTGIGIPASKLNQIFEPFAQADDSVTRLYGGTGLGTTIAKQLIGLMGGTLTVESQQGMGSKFWFEIPLPRTEKAGIDLAEEFAASRAAISNGGRGYGGSTALAERLRGARVLVAEDNPTNQRVTKMILESGGHFATIVTNGEEALEALEKDHFDIALFDLSMPKVSGIDALKLYRFTTDRPIPVIILSANVTVEAISECHSAGAVEFVAKPVRASVMLEAIDRNLDVGTAEVRHTVNNRAATSRRETTSIPGSSAEGARAASSPRLSLVDTSAVDPNVLEELEQFSSDPTFVERLIEGFLSDCERLSSQIQDGLSKRRYDSVKDAAHALRGASGSVGANQLYQFATRVDKSSYENIRLQAGKLSQELTSLIERTKSDLTTYSVRRLERFRSAN
jgi:two-component system sensor histidine kinase RpfC